MALLNDKGEYIKLCSDGMYEIYASEEARLKVKNSTPGGVIIAKYQTLINDLEQQHERWYYDSEAFDAEYQAIYAEYYRYEYNYIHHISGQSYPIMMQYYADVNDSIAEIIESGKIVVKDTDLAQAYINAKIVNRWGNTIDV